MALQSRIDKHQDIRLRRLGMGAISYLGPAAIALVAAAWGVLDWRYLGHYMLAAAFIVGAFYGLFKSNLNLRLREPNLTLPQILAPVLPVLYVMYHVTSLDARTALLLTAIVPLLYGLFDLTRLQFVTVSLLNLLGYSAMAALIIYHHPDQLHEPGQWVVLMALAVVLVQIGLIGGFISQLRQTLRQKNLQLNEAMTRISEMAVRDELTGSYNRRHLIEVLETEIARSARNEAGFSVCLIDLDHFKQINDRHGHLTGDDVLRRCAQCIEDSRREIDTFGRYGGEEFMLIMPMTGGDAACTAVSRHCTDIENLGFLSDDHVSFGVTISIGVAESLPHSRPQTDDVLRRADRALYDAKTAGRNRVRLAAP